MKIKQIGCIIYIKSKIYYYIFFFFFLENKKHQNCTCRTSKTVDQHNNSLRKKISTHESEITVKLKKNGFRF